MKFRRILRKQVEQTLPNWRDKFLSYKDLKKQLKIICPRDTINPSPLDAPETKEVNYFLHLLELEIDKLNAFFVEREEEYVIKWKDFEEEGCGTVSGNENRDTLMQVPKELAEIENMENVFIKLTLSALNL